MNREIKITFRVSEYEKKQIMSRVKTAKVKLSDFCRCAALSKEVKRIDGLLECSYELNKIGNNLNQMATLCHQRVIHNPNLADMQKKLSAIIERIYSISDGGVDDGDSQTD